MATTRRITESFPHSKNEIQKGTTLHTAGRGIAQDSYDAQVDEHQAEKVLRLFDLETKYGPVSGMTRLERFERAEKLGLSPPPGVKALILKFGVDGDTNKHLFTQGKV